MEAALKHTFISTPKYFISDPSRISGLTNGERQKMTFGTVNLLSLIRSINYDREHTLNLTYCDIAKRLGCGRTTIARAVATIKKYNLAEIASSRVSSVYAFNFASEGEREEYYRSEYWFYTNSFHFNFVRKKDGKIITTEEDRKLKPSEIRVLSIIYTYCTNSKSRTKEYSASIRELSALSGLSERSVKAAIAALIAAHLITRKKKGVGKLARSTYALTRKYKHIEKEFEKSSKKAKLTEAQDEAYRIERERFYAERRADAQAEADSLKNHFMKIPKFAELSNRSNELVIKIAKAQVFKLPELLQLEAEQKAIRNQKLQILAAENYSEEDLLPQWFCKKCSDTGFLPSGRACDCYRK